ncbi:MAG: hypothetical protein HY296_06135 [Thaumarchaeota archaeon]|nr:hypothetical protein [Nitrososphaerota archaeon]
MASGTFLQSASHNLILNAVSVATSLFGAFFLFSSFLKVRSSPYSSRMGASVSEIVWSSVPKSLLVTSTLFGVANVSIYLMQTFSFVGTDIWTFLNTPVTVVGWLLFEGILSSLSLLARTSS